MGVKAVRAHTNAVGEFKVNHFSVRDYVTPGGYLYTSGSMIMRDYSYKSPTVKGSIVNGFKRPTNYHRCIVRSDPGTMSARELDFSGKLRYTFSGQGQQAGFTWAIPFWNSSAKKVVLPDGIRQEAINRALSKVANQRVNVGVAIGETKTTINMIGQSMTRLLRAYRAFRAKNWHQAYRILYGKKKARRYRHDHTKTAANLWLEWWYGWYPLLMDIYGGLETLREGFRSKDQIFSVTALEARDYDGQLLALSPAAARLPGRQEASIDSVRASAKVKLWGKVLFQAHHNGSSLGLINPVSIAWELVPFSFVIDWLIPIGEWLESLSATSGTQFVAGCVTEVVEVQAVYRDMCPGVSKDPSRYESSATNFSVRMLAMSRTQLLSWPWGTLYVKDPLSTKHLITALALLKQTKLR